MHERQSKKKNEKESSPFFSRLHGRWRKKRALMMFKRVTTVYKAASKYPANRVARKIEGDSALRVASNTTVIETFIV